MRRCTEPGPGCAPARDASLQERVATRRRNLLWGAKWAGGVAEGRRQPRPSSTSGSRVEPITLERGVTHDTAFEQWVNMVWALGSQAGAEISLKSFRKDIIIELFNEA